MSRLVTLFTGQWADLPLEDMCRKASDFGYQGLELACWGDHFEINKAAVDPGYAAGTIKRYPSAAFFTDYRVMLDFGSGVTSGRAASIGNPRAEERFGSESRSTSRIRCPARERTPARSAQTVVLPAPPFPATATFKPTHPPLRAPVGKTPDRRRRRGPAGPTPHRSA